MSKISATVAHRRRFVIGGAALVSCIVVVGVFLLIGFHRGPRLFGATQVRTGATGPTALVPSVVGDTQSQAQATLVQSGYVAQVDPVARGSAPGTVLTESPTGGSRLPLGSKVVLEVSAATQ